MKTDSDTFVELFSQQKMNELFPADRADHFFDALLGDVEEGAYDIRLSFKKAEPNQLVFNLELHERPGKCLRCNLTYGLPNVFSRHPIINIQGVVDQIDLIMGDYGSCIGWQLGKTVEVTPAMHVVPLLIDIDEGAPS